MLACPCALDMKSAALELHRELVGSAWKIKRRTALGRLLPDTTDCNRPIAITESQDYRYELLVQRPQHCAFSNSIEVARPPNVTELSAVRSASIVLLRSIPCVPDP
jgi:hypothetical protein